ncbi:hypothetical protein HPP92_028369 [Vanilla planifolia]|uniref:Presenilin n=1 Tax=Vanilla planifolia TaxID=51239 RepID=A0A835P9E9_VANPL|nr:hypothetical protein HPP92_028369 [Vanilla planifolia]
MPISLTQGYLVVIAVLVAYCFTLLPEWTTWALLVSVAVYDLAAVLLPVGPLRILVELAISRDEEIPALVYEARPVEPISSHRRRLWRERRDFEVNPGTITPNAPIIDQLLQETSKAIAGEGSVGDSSTPELEAPLVPRLPGMQEMEDVAEGIGLGSSGAIKLGLGDFIFYSVLVGRAAIKALPALPVSIALGLCVYLLTRELLEVFVVQFSTNLLMF